MMAIEIVREYFNKATPDEVDFILWNKTGFPGFWRGDPETCLRDQLKLLKTAWLAGRDVCYCCGKSRKRSEMVFEMCKVGVKFLSKNK